MFALRLVFLLALPIVMSTVYGHPTIGHHGQEELIPPCEGCGDQCHKCLYGFAISKLCGILVCRRGPGAVCGGPSDSWGVCGEGLICNDCNRCVGCSLETYLCDREPCLSHKTMESRWTGMFTVDK